MNKELIDRAWACLPKEFKEEAKSRYKNALRFNEYSNMCVVLSSLFGENNLTSDAEGEEMLTVPRKDIIELYQEVQKTISQCKGTELAMQSIGIRNVLWSFFGSKCLPDGNEVNFATKEPKPAEPKFKVGDKVKDISSPHDDGIYKVDDIKKISDGFIYHIQGLIGVSDVKESNLKPYTESENKDSGFTRVESVKESRIASEESHLRNLSRDSNRLQIASMAMQGMLSNTTRFSSYEISDLVRISLNCADALITEAEKGGINELRHNILRGRELHTKGTVPPIQRTAPLLARTHR